MDWGRRIEDAWQANPPCTNPRCDWKLRFGEVNDDEQGTRKNF